MKLIHVTPATNLSSIQSDGLSGTSYWAGDCALAEYYAETISDEGETPVFIEVDLADLDESLFEPDYPSISEPIMSCVRQLHGWSRYDGEERVHAEWETLPKTWRESLKLVGSARYRGTIPSDKLSFDEPERPPSAAIPA